MPTAKLTRDGKPLSDRTILNWLTSHMKKPGKRMHLVLSDARDMGYRRDFISCWHNRSPEGEYIKGNSVRHVLSNLIRRERALLNNRHEQRSPE